MRRQFFLLFFFIAANIFSQSDSLITLNEVMFYPTGSNTEFIELFNLSFSDSIDLSGWKIIYSISTADKIIYYKKQKIPPRGYAIIFEGDYDTTNGIYNSIIPKEAAWYKIDNNAFGTSGMSNSSDRTLFLLNSANDTIDTYTYSANNQMGYSDEKINETNDNTSTNWTNSKTINGSPGKKNTVALALNDIKISNAFFSTQQPKQDENFDLTVIVKNIGVVQRNIIPLKIFVDFNHDTLFTDDEIKSQTIIDELNHSDSAIIQFQYSFNTIGKFSFLIVCDTLNDENKSNNYYNLVVNILPPAYNYNEIVINEIMYQPMNEEPEWIEFYNQSNKAIEIMNFSIKDKSTKSKISTESKIIMPKEYFIAARDSSIFDFYDSLKNVFVIALPTLNNTDDEIVLQDAYGNTIDSLHYFSNWGGNNGKSLERKYFDKPTNDNSNWATSQSSRNATPAIENSVAWHEKDLVLNIYSGIKNYYDFNEQITFSLTIKNAGRTIINDFVIKESVDSIFVKESTYAFSISSNDSIIISYTLNSLLLGIHKINLKLYVDNQEYNDNNEINFLVNIVQLKEERNDLVINEIMFAPISPMPEWLEIYNRSEKEINLKGYQIADATSKNIVVHKSIILKPDEYLVIAKDSLINNFYELNNFIVSAFPSLNNSGDKVILLDSLNRTIDSVSYKSSWGSGSGFSLERIDADKNSSDSTNWSSSTSYDKGTPGLTNSVAIKDYEIRIKSFDFNPRKPKPEDDIHFSVVLFNSGKKDAHAKVRLNKIHNSFDSTKSIIEESSEISIPPGDSINFLFTKTDKLFGQSFNYLVEVIITELGDTNFDSVSKTVFPAIPKTSVIINEIMYAPINGEPEWIELFNPSVYDIDLNNSAIADVITTPLIKKISENSLIIKSNNYLIISKDTSIISFHNDISTQMVITNFANLNNDKDGVVLYDYYNDVVDSVFYKSSFGGTSGKSLERKSIEKSSADSSNWGSSKDLENSTPGRINSLSKKNFDLTVDSILITPESSIVETPVTIYSVIKNMGFNEAKDFQLHSKISELGKTIAEKDTIISSLSSMSSISLKLIKLPMKETFKVFVNCIYNDDEDTTNNSYQREFRAASQKKEIIITEFMTYPNENDYEWIEIYNNSSHTINLKNYSIADKIPTENKYKITDTDYFLNSKEYLILIPDNKDLAENIKSINTKIPSLGNDEDGIILFDYNDSVVDSFSYKKIKTKRGVSVERREDNDGHNYFHLSMSREGNSMGIENSINSVLSIQPKSLLINEIMYEPSSMNSEFIEIYNPTSEAISIGGAFLLVNGNYICDLSDTLYTISENNFYLIVSVSSLFHKYIGLDISKINLLNTSLSLTNNGGKIVIKDFFNNTIDSIYYSPDWHNSYYSSTQDVSLERISMKTSNNQADNWSSSVSKNGATPLEINSIFIENKNPENKLSIHPNPFSPDNDGFEDFTIISYSSKSNILQIRIRIFDDRGRLVRHLVDNQITGSKTEFIFDGKDDDGNYLRIGMYILLLETFDQSNKKVETHKKIIVVARKL